VDHIRHIFLLDVGLFTLLPIIEAIFTSPSSFFAGQHVGPEPNKDLCVIQTSLMYGIAPMYVPVVYIIIHVHYLTDILFVGGRLRY
jgi:hypothetical protein